MTIRETSIDAYHQISTEGLLSERRWQVYNVLFQFGPLTGNEVFNAVKSEYSVMAGNAPSIVSRLGELREMGVVKELGTRICTVTGMTVILWDVTKNLPTKIQKQKRTKCHHCGGRGFTTGDMPQNERDQMDLNLSITITGKTPGELAKKVLATGEALNAAIHKTPAQHAANVKKKAPAAADDDEEQGFLAAPDDDEGEELEATDDDETLDDVGEEIEAEDEPAPKAKKTAAATAKPAAKTKSAKVTEKEVNAAAMAYAKTHGRKKTLALLEKKFGAKSILEIPAEKYAKVVEALNA